MSSDYDMCSCDWEDYETIVYRAKRQRARKPYICEECGGPIAPGDEYEYAFGICYDHSTWAVRTCAPCVDGPLAFVKRNCGCWLHGGDWLRDHLTQVFNEYGFTKPGVKFRLGRMLIEMDHRGGRRKFVVR